MRLKFDLAKDSMSWRNLKLLDDERGYILGLVMVFFVVFSITGLAMLDVGRHERTNGLKNYNQAKALYYAHTGIHQGLWRISKISNVAGTFSDATVSVVYDSVGLTLTATGTAGTAQKIIRVTVEVTSSSPTGGWPYAIYTDTDTLNLTEGTGTITGDVHSNTSATSDAGFTITGTTTTSPYVAPPTITWSFFQTEASNAGQYSTSDLSFTSGGSPYTGVWYTTREAQLYDNAVINGTIVAEEEIEFEGNNITVTATPSNYPALLSQDKVKGEDNPSNIQVTGLVYTNDHFHKEFTNFTLTGAIIAIEEFHKTSSNFVVTYDATYTTNVAGTNIGGGSGSSSTYSITKWEEL